MSNLTINEHLHLLPAEDPVHFDPGRVRVLVPVHEVLDAAPRHLHHGDRLLVELARHLEARELLELADGLVQLPQRPDLAGAPPHVAVLGEVGLCQVHIGGRVEA